jgi:hypothetical protein
MTPQDLSYWTWANALAVQTNRNGSAPRHNQKSSLTLASDQPSEKRFLKVLHATVVVD